MPAGVCCDYKHRNEVVRVPDRVRALELRHQRRQNRGIVRVEGHQDNGGEPHLCGVIELSKEAASTSRSNAVDARTGCGHVTHREELEEGKRGGAVAGGRRKEMECIAKLVSMNRKIE